MRFPIKGLRLTAEALVVFTRPPSGPKMGFSAIIGVEAPYLVTKLYTKQGDDGHTVLFDGTHVSKTNARVETYGVIDELNAALGLTASYLARIAETKGVATLHERLIRIQGELFTMGAELATPPNTNRRDALGHIDANHISSLESWIDEAADVTPPLQTFILPGGCPAAAQLHIARTVCRRAERRVVALGDADVGNPNILIYLNRLGDLLFAWARLTNQLVGIDDIPWHPSS